MPQVNGIRNEQKNITTNTKEIQTKGIPQRAKEYIYHMTQLYPSLAYTQRTQHPTTQVLVQPYLFPITRKCKQPKCHSTGV